MTTSFDFTGHVVVVTGAAQGIGAAITKLFVDANASVAAIDRNASMLEETWSGNERVKVFPVDITDAAATAAVIDATIDWAGEVSVAINNAGITRDSVVWRMEDEQWSSVLDVHLTGTFNVTRAVIPSMRRRGGGRVINVTSYTGLRGNVGQANYAAAKAGIVGFTKTVAREVARFGITANAVSPNALTPMVEAVPEDARARLAADIPLGRFADPAEIAPAVGFLASDEAAYITGTVLPVDGGMAT